MGNGDGETEREFLTSYCAGADRMALSGRDMQHADDGYSRC